MESKNWMELFNGEAKSLKEIRTANEYTEKFGLVLSEEDAKALISEKKECLKEQRRVEFKESILSKIIYKFCDSPYVQQSDYKETLGRLQEIFFLYKNEMMDEITDDELLNFMREQFDEVCFGDLDYLESTCLDLFAQAIRAGYGGFRSSEGCGEFSQFDITPRWDRELYLETLRELCWR